MPVTYPGTMSDTLIAFSDALGRRVRMGSWQDQRISTYRKIHEAIDEGEWDVAAQLANYFVDEASVCWGIYRQWILDLNAFLAQNGVEKADIAAANERDRGHARAPRRLALELRTQLAQGPRAVRAARRPHLPRGAPRGAREARRAQGDVAADATTATSTTPTA